MVGESISRQKVRQGAHKKPPSKPHSIEHAERLQKQSPGRLYYGRLIELRRRLLASL